MNSKIKSLIRIGGVLNSLLALFHVYLAYQIFKVYGGQDFYPLMQMLNVAGSLMIFFFAFTSLAYAGQLAESKVGRAVIILNIILYLTRTAGELVLFPQPNVFIIAVCLLIAVVYSYAYLSIKKLTLTRAMG